MSWFSEFFDNWKRKKGYKWGKTRAIAKLRVFRHYKSHLPDMPNKELYYLTVLTGSSFNEETAADVIYLAERFTNSLVEPTPLSLRWVIKSVLNFEGIRLFGHLSFDDKDSLIFEAHNAVDDVIPEEL